MKKLSTLIALALIVTIGGVYAAWHYNRGQVSLEISRSATMASIQSDTSKGTITIDQTANSGNGNTLKFLVDDTGTIDWKADLVPSGSVWVKFTAAANADAIVQTNGIKMKATVTLSGTQEEYAGKKIFEVKEDANTFTINATASLDSQEITAEQIAACLEFNEGAEVVLDTYDDNVAYETAMKTYIIVITISEA
ncbi:MAG: hypothetical protein IKV74_02230 [Clostridia bacterium]|nr:hypothetical protein [Clostridia bacterium]